MSKAFDQAHYDADDNAKHLLIGWLEERGFMAWVNDDQFGIDVQAVKMGELYEFEVEVKHNWKTENFPFDSVHFSARKLKFVKPNTYNWFTMFSHDRTNALFVSGLVLSKCVVVEKNTIYTNGERFMEVPLAQCLHRNIGSVA